ncbi:F-box domain-containing protein [Colletotrichum salicis]|uniref:F-box domain-containing protein n=1 Tax=Colletotrichum salicis TaxID=1209931 RepID=A0A135V9T9_9PEZI|nr:F-box domain-containing protein [Colletotrichum salicis]
MQKLPFDLMFDIAKRLAPQDVWSLRHVCKQFDYLTQNETIAKATLEKHAAYSIEMKEARQSGCYAQALRRRVKFQDAVTTAKPYSVGIVAWADQYIYCNGMLCYTQNETKEFFLLNLHQPAPNEIVINVDELLATTNQILPNEKYELRPIHYSDNILSWLYIPLENTGRNKLFEVVGSDVGTTAAFEIFGHHFYAASSVQPTAFGEDVYLSRYYGVRYPLGVCRAEDKQLLSESMFRRDHREGPINDIWSTLSLEKNPKTGVLEVVECRREHSAKGDGNSRTAYRTAVQICNGDFSDDFLVGEGSEQKLVEFCGFQGQAPNLKEYQSTPHRGDDGFTEPLVTSNNCFMRSYNIHCEAFIDLFNLTAADGLSSGLNIRTISRSQAVTHEQPDSQEMGNKAKRVESIISYWPPQTHPDGNCDESKYLAHALRVQEPHWDIFGVADDRSLVYIQGDRETKDLNPLVFISFDPSIKLPGVWKWLGPTAEQRTCEVEPHSGATAKRRGLVTPVVVSSDCINQRP